MRLETRMAKEEMRASHMERVMRWTQKTQSSPLAVDLWAEDERKFEHTRAKQAAEKRQKLRMERQELAAHSTILDKASAEQDELEMLRAEKRQLAFNQKRLKAMKDVEKSNARVAKFLHSREQVERDRQTKMLERALSSPGF